jgi:hypothetical protein
MWKEGMFKPQAKRNDFVTCKLRKNDMPQADLVKSLKLQIAKWALVQNPIDCSVQENKCQ